MYKQHLLAGVDMKLFEQTYIALDIAYLKLLQEVMRFILVGKKYEVLYSWFFKGLIKVSYKLIGAGFVLISLTHLNNKVVLVHIAPKLLILSVYWLYYWLHKALVD